MYAVRTRSIRGAVRHAHAVFRTVPRDTVASRTLSTRSTSLLTLTVAVQLTSVGCKGGCRDAVVTGMETARTHDSARAIRLYDARMSGTVSAVYSAFGSYRNVTLTVAGVSDMMLTGRAVGIALAVTFGIDRTPFSAIACADIANPRTTGFNTRC